MNVSVAVIMAWWCRCGWYTPSRAGGSQLVREHLTRCSFGNRFGDNVNSRWTASECVTVLDTATHVWTDRSESGKDLWPMRLGGHG